MKILASSAFWSLSFLLTACSVSPAGVWTTPGSPSFKLTREEQMAALEAATPCCLRFADMPYTKIESMPFDDYFNIDQSSPVLAESGSKSFALGLELPANAGAKRLDFLSVQTSSWIRKGGYFSPEVIVLDEAFNELIRRDDFLFDAEEEYDIPVTGIKGQVALPSNARYVVFRTNERRLASRSAFIRVYESIYSVKNYEAAIARPPGVYSDRVVVRPHLPVGQIWISVSSP